MRFFGDVTSDFPHHHHFAKFYHLSSPLTNWPPIDAKAIVSLTSATFFSSILCIRHFQLFYLLSARTPHNQPSVLLVSVTTNWPTDAIKRMEIFTAENIWSFSGSLRNCPVWDQAFGEGLERKTKSPTAYPGGLSRIIFCCKLPRVVLSRFKSSKSQKWIIFPSHLSMRPDSWPHCGVPYGWVVILTLFLQFYVNLGNYDDSIRNYNNTAKLAQLIW